MSGLRSMFDAQLSLGGSRSKMHHELESLSMGRLRTSRTIYPDCLPMDESIGVVCFDELDPSLMRVGGSNGSIATGSLSRARNEEAYYPNDEQGWRTGWVLPARITSLLTCGDRMLATCLGPPAQAIVATTQENISLASVTLSPRKTSLWTSALSPDLVALGCDKKVLTSRDPSRPSMDGYVTGSQRGDGAVFALDLTENLIFAGTRKGQVKMFDQRSSPSKEDRGGDAPETRAETQLSISSSVTHVRRLQDGLLVAGMDGSLGMYDLRFPSTKPYLVLEGHVNSFTSDIGLDVWRDDFVAAAGQDSRIRLWSLRTGSAILPPTNPTSPSSTSRIFSPDPSLLLRTFSEPIKALTFAGSDSLARHRRRDDGRGRIELEREGGRKGERGPVLWVGDGPGLECFEVAGARGS
ncbi:hypothetical protein BCR35DRAFT_331198 [Leucosporidium creatinivorum]|uniref:WD40-repeat-containing domain protein n=1 Tax=Leucosporidium creatinivorum TaxID=106004 RepID=A0A1Y2FIW9_9BASI|nr:hypothetical protein BCR35DRAFT_331198 [Leucosporidium creatinivorum]